MKIYFTHCWNALICKLTYLCLCIYNNIFCMIKKNQANARQQLLRKNSDDSTLQYPPF